MNRYLTNCSVAKLNTTFRLTESTLLSTSKKMAESGQEVATIKAYWDSISVPEKEVKRPTLRNVNMYKDVPVEDRNICGIFVIHGQKEYVYFAGQSVLDKEPRNTNHIRAMNILLKKLGLTKEKAKFNFIVGFYLECGVLKKCSCVNIIFSSTVTRALGEMTSGYLDVIFNSIKSIDIEFYNQLMGISTDKK